MCSVYDYDPTVECYDCMEERKEKREAREFLSMIVEHLYSNAPVNEAMLEHNLEELCSFFGLSLPKNDQINLTRRDSSKSIVADKSAIKDWIEFNNNYLKNL